MYSFALVVHRVTLETITQLTTKCVNSESEDEAAVELAFYNIIY